MVFAGVVVFCFFPAADCYCNKTYGLIFSRSSHLKHPGQQLPQQEQEVMVVVGPTPSPPTPNPGPTICPSYISAEQTGWPSGAAQRVQMILPSVNKDESCKRKSIKDELYALHPPTPPSRHPPPLHKSCDLWKHELPSGADRALQRICSARLKVSEAQTYGRF